MTPVWFVVAAGVGALLRHLVGQVTTTWTALLCANAAGSCVLGYVVASGQSAAVSTVVGTAFCGALTTFSSATLETHDLGRRRGAVYAVAMLAVCLGAVAIGSVLGG